jgi:hypothetical protein
MSDDKPPKGPGWENAPGVPEQTGPNSIAHKSEQDKINKLRADLPKLLAQMKEKGQGRANQFYPYILIRSVLGDRGDRPLSVPFWESPDIWTAAGDPATTPAVPPDHGGSLTAGKPHTVYAHVWNLGRAPIAGVKVEFYWFNPSLGIDGAHANLIGMTRVDLGPRSSPGCHKLVKCPKAWMPQMVNGGHECLVARASAIGDNISATHPWEPWADRHVGQRNVHVAPAMTDISKLITSLDATRLGGTRIQLLQIGEHAELTLKMAAPHLKVDPSVKTHVLAELRADGSLHLPATVAVVPGGQPAAATNVAQAATAVSAVPRVVPDSVLRLAKVAVPATRVQTARPTELLPTGGNVEHLVAHATLLSPEVLKEIRRLQPPGPGLAQVLRFVSFRGDQMVGGYTVIVQGQ